MLMGEVQAFFWDWVKDSNPYSFKEMANFRIGMFRKHIDKLLVENLATMFHVLFTDGKNSTVSHVLNINSFEMRLVPFIKGTNIRRKGNVPRGIFLIITVR